MLYTIAHPPPSGICTMYANARTLARCGAAELIRHKPYSNEVWLAIAVGGYAAGEHVRVVRLPEYEPPLRAELEALLPLIDAKARIPRADLRAVETGRGT
jgi:hypothetical protein